jgi:hypothetical protein
MHAIFKREAAAACLFVCWAAMAQAQTPVVVSAIVNSVAQQITITGTNLAPTAGSPVVKLDALLLTLLSSSSTQGQGAAGTGPLSPSGTFRARGRTEHW